jgi:FlaA1/EpsC-like NDP-sugar epimerase
VVRGSLLLLLYTAILFVSWWLAHQLRFDFDVWPEWHETMLAYWPVILVMKLLFLHLFGQFSGLLSYFSIPDLRRIFSSMAVSSGVLLLAYYTGGFVVAPRGVILIDFILSFTGLAVMRLGFRVVREQYLAPHGLAWRQARRVGIIGAGDVGANLARN